MNIDSASQVFLNNTEIVRIIKNGATIWEKVVGPDYTEPFYLENTGTSAKTANIYKYTSSAPSITIQYSTNKTTWTSLGSTNGTSSSSPLNLNVPAKSKVYLRCSTNSWCVPNAFNKIKYSDTIGGNIMSLVYGSSFTGDETTYPNNSSTHIFYCIFESTSITDASKLLLPATTIPQYSYYRMFANCTKLVNAPEELPGTTLDVNCYQGMFNGCSLLVNAPSILPATTLYNYCYESMFKNCTALVNAPSLPAKTMKEHCYDSMFNGCTSLVTAPSLPAKSLIKTCYISMFEGCTALLNAPSLPSTSAPQSCYYRMFANCTALVNAPSLPATSLYGSCYESMFEGCTALVNAPALSATSLYGSCYKSMFKGCTKLTNSPSLPATTINGSSYEEMFYGCTKLKKVTVYANTIQTDGTKNWLYGVAASGDFYKLGSANFTTGVNGIPSGWTVHTSL